jgi:ribosomal protein S18 acetylase RimI-like enzyme
VNEGASPDFELQGAKPEDFEGLLALRLRAMRESLTQIGRYDEQRARERLSANFDVAATHHIVVAGQRVGFVVLKRLSHAMRLDHLYIEPALQRRGIGTRLMAQISAKADAQLLPLELCALKGSDANGFYLRLGFVQTGEGDWDIDYLRMPLTPSLRAVRTMWSCFQARDWAGARALLRDDLVARWWSSGERFDQADGFIEAQARYPEGWTISLVELAHLQDGRVLSLVRVDHPPQTFFATSFFRVDDGRITAIDEYWSTVEPPPAWRETLPARSRFDPQDDRRARQP